MKLQTTIFARVRIALVISALGVAATQQAADHRVTMTSDWKFSPVSIEINVGDTVTWLNLDDDWDHDATSTTALWTTGSVAPDESVTLQFLTTGTYPYQDSLFSPLGMDGTIVVKGTTVIPTPATLTNAMSLPDGAFRFTITNLTPGLATVVQFSTNLVDWSAFETNYPSGKSIEYTNTAAGFFPQFFHRCYQTP